MTGALSHIRVLDLSRILAGPWASQFLADCGADVIKVERPQGGDDTRHWGPPFMETETQPNAAYYHCANRNKESITVDISKEEGQALIRQLVVSCDVVLENYKVGGLKKYGLDYDSLKDINPEIVYCSVTGFGQDGPYSHRAGYDFMIQAMGGLMSLTGEPDGMPMKVGVAQADILTGLYAANAIQAALLHRSQTGEGQYIDLSLLDVQVATLANQAMNYLASDENPERLGNAHPNIVPYQAFSTTDGHIILAIGNDRQFETFCKLANAPELATNPSFATNEQRVINRTDLLPLISQLVAVNSTKWWLDILAENAVPAGPINNLDQVFQDPQVLHRGMKIDLPTGLGDSVSSVANPVLFSKTPVEYRNASPQLGEHTQSILERVLGLSTDEIEKLKASGALGN